MMDSVFMSRVAVQLDQQKKMIQQQGAVIAQQRKELEALKALMLTQAAQVEKLEQRVETLEKVAESDARRRAKTSQKVKAYRERKRPTADDMPAVTYILTGDEVIQDRSFEEKVQAKIDASNARIFANVQASMEEYRRKRDDDDSNNDDGPKLIGPGGA